MAFISTQPRVRVALTGAFDRLIEFMVSMFERQSAYLSRQNQIDALEAKSDRELAEMGLTRDRILPYVFRDIYYI